MYAIITFHFGRRFHTQVPLHRVLQEGFQTGHGALVAPGERGSRRRATAELRVGAGREVGGQELRELPGHP